MIKEDMMSLIIGDEYIEDPEERERRIAVLTADAVEDACAEIDGYLAKRYRVPFRRTPKVLNKLAKDIAAYNLVSRAGIDESDREKTYLTRYEAAVKFLLHVAEGKISVGEDEDSSTAQGAADGFRMQSADRVFSRQSMRGW